jgi:hypothetical protein
VKAGAGSNHLHRKPRTIARCAISSFANELRSQPMNVLEVMMPNGKLFKENTGADIQKFHEMWTSFLALASGWGENETFADHENDVLDCMKKFYPRVSRDALKMWFSTFRPETFNRALEALVPIKD